MCGVNKVQKFYRDKVQLLKTRQILPRIYVDVLVQFSQELGS